MDPDTMLALVRRRKEINKIMKESESYPMPTYKAWVASGEMRRLLDEYDRISEKFKRYIKRKARTGKY